MNISFEFLRGSCPEGFLFYFSGKAIYILGSARLRRKKQDQQYQVNVFSQS
jgi:hypothetical protein